MCVRKRESERVCAWKRESKRERVCERDRAKESVSERVRERVCLGERERKRNVCVRFAKEPYKRDDILQKSPIKEMIFCKRDM